MRFVDELVEVRHVPDIRMHVVIVGDIVTVVTPRRRIERQEPERIHAQLLQIVELGDQARKISDSVTIAIKERLDVQLVDDGVLVP